MKKYISELIQKHEKFALIALIGLIGLSIIVFLQTRPKKEWKIIDDSQGERFSCFTNGKNGEIYLTKYYINDEGWKTIKEPTCLQTGEKVAKATVYDETIEIHWEIPSKHDFTKWEIKKEPTCLEEGSRERRCLKCDNKEEEKIAMKSHKWSKWKTLKKSTCDSEGEKERECEKCHTIENKFIKQMPHEWGEWIIKKRATIHQKRKETKNL